MSRTWKLTKTVLGVRPKKVEEIDKRVIVPPHPSFRVPVNFVRIGDRPNILIVPVGLN